MEYTMEERFAIIDEKLQANICRLCRLCGMDNQNKVYITDQDKDPDGEPSLNRKIQYTVGVKINQIDNMPHTVCGLCVDKINDFFEFREMCSATNRQTRRLLGLPVPPIPAYLIRGPPVNNDNQEPKSEVEIIIGIGSDDQGNCSTDSTDNKSPVKLRTKSKSSAPPKKKGNSKKSASVKDEEVKVESGDIKAEVPTKKVNSRQNGKRLKVDLKKVVDSTPLLTQKEPNKRERRREIDAHKLERRRIREEQKREIEEKKRQIELAKQILERKKLEKMRKRKSSDPEPPVKRLKEEEPEVDITSLYRCSICSTAHATNELLSTHLYQSHTVTISTYGCSSCAESFKSSGEEKDHELWHSMSKTSYICPICNVAFDKTSIFTRHITLCKPFNLSPTVTNIHCDKCSQEFLTQNLYQWHGCFVKANGKCWHCNRTFVKASTLFKHSFKCSRRQSTDSQHDPKKRPKSRTYDCESHIKSEPEANLDMDVSTSHLLTSDMLPVVVLTKTIFKPNQPIGINTEDMSIKTENEFDIDDNIQNDEPFRDADDSDGNDELDETNGVANAMDETGTYSDDDVILIENHEEPVLVSGSPSRNTVEKQFVLPIVIKREPVDTYEVITPPIYDPAKKIKTEPMEDEYSPKRRRNKKSSHKHKERHHLVRIKEEPFDFDSSRNGLFRTVPTNNLGSAFVSMPTTNLLKTRIKQEPIRNGYGDDYDPVLAMNIKKEPGLEDSSSCRLPLRLIISKKHGTLNSKLISPQGDEIENVERPHRSSKSKRTKDKGLYKKPALLAEKIKQEMIERQERDETTTQPNKEDLNDFTVPVIAKVLDGTTINNLPMVRVKDEPKSPSYSSCYNPESILESLCSDALPSDSLDCSRDPIHEFGYDPFCELPSNGDNDCNSSMVDFSFPRAIDDVGKEKQPATTIGLLNMDMTENDDLKSDTLDLEALCQLRPISGTSTTAEPIRGAEITSAGTMLYCRNGEINGTTSTDMGSTNQSLIELARMTLSDYMKDSNDIPNGQIAFCDPLSNPLIENHQKSFNPIAFDDFTVGKNTFKIPDEHKTSYEVIDEIINNLPLSGHEDMVKVVNSLNSNGVSNMNNLSNTCERRSSKEKTDGRNSVFNDSRKLNIDVNINYLNVNSHTVAVKPYSGRSNSVKPILSYSKSLTASGESQLENSSICNGMLVNGRFRLTEEMLANGVDDVHDVDELLKSPINDNTDYEQTLTESAINEQLNSLLEDISEGSLSCDTDTDNEDKKIGRKFEVQVSGN